MVSQAVVAAGGRGARMGEATRKFGNKSLIEINTKPILFFTLDWLRRVGIERMILTVNHSDLLERISELFKADDDIEVVQNTYTKTSAQCLPPLIDRVDNRFLFVYGYAPAPPEHLRSLMRVSVEGIAVSLYSSTTQGDTRKSAALSGTTVEMSEEDKLLFIEPPHILDKDFVRNLSIAQSWKAGFKSYKGQISGVVAKHPPEFHYEADFRIFENFMGEYLKNK